MIKQGGILLGGGLLATVVAIGVARTRDMELRPQDGPATGVVAEKQKVVTADLAQPATKKNLVFELWIDTDGDGTPDSKDIDDDDDWLTDAQEKALGTNPLKSDTDGDGYSDWEEVNLPWLTNPPATYYTSGIKKAADPTVPDVFLEIDYMRPKGKILWWDYCGHEPDGEYLEDMIDRFQEHGRHMFIIVDDRIPHYSKVNKDAVFSLKGIYQDYPGYYYCLFADEGDGLAAHGVSWPDTNNLVVFEGVWYLIGDLVGMTLMHELGHLMIDWYWKEPKPPQFFGYYWPNPKAAHFMDKPDVWNDGKHCPYNCVLNYASNMSVWDAIGQWWEFDFCSKCWNALRGFYDKP